MAFYDWIERTWDQTQQDGLKGLQEGMHELYSGAWRTFGWHVPRGENIFKFDWDILIILDACRIDLLKEFESEYEFIHSVGRKTSVGSMSEEWMKKTFNEKYSAEIANTAYVTANLFSDDILNASQFKVLDEVWKYGWVEEKGVVPPRPVTERAVKIGREYDVERLIVHYMQPHHPFIGEVSIDGDIESDPFGQKRVTTAVDALRRGDISYDHFWNAYRSNLRLVLDDVSVLLSNVDAETAILTADHGDALGEWGVYDHPAGCLHPVVTDVPWVETQATDERTLDPSIEPDQFEASVSEKLKDLGYLD